MAAPTPLKARRIVKASHASFYRSFHDYFVTHLPSSSLHPDSRSSSGPHHQLPRSASKPHNAASGPSPAPLLGGHRDTTVVRIPLRSAKHHFGVSVSRGTRPYNEDTYQAGVIEIPAFAKPQPSSFTRAPTSSPLQAYREKQKERQEQSSDGGNGEGTSADGASGDPQVFYFGVFDGHGGSECSDFLREKLHGSIEETAKKYGLESTLQGKNGKTREKQVDTSLNRETAPETSQSPTSSTSQTPSLSTSPSDPTALQETLTKSWRETVGGYFRRFSPFTSTTPDSPSNPTDSPTPTISTILTHAFLSLDLHFLQTQLRLLSLTSQSSDHPINANDLGLYTPAHFPSSDPQPSKPFKGGSTASIALISTPTPTPFWHPSTPSTLYTAHCGDTRILLCRVRDGAAVPLTTNHHPSAPSESQRLRRYAASFVTDSFGEERMSGLANTRAFGDMPSKRMGVSAEPEISHLQLSPSEYSFMVLVSDGVTGSASDQEIVDVVKEERTPEMAARKLVRFADEVSPEEGDNATAIVVRLGGWERRGEGGGGSLGTKEGREWRVREAGSGGRAGLR